MGIQLTYKDRMRPAGAPQNPKHLILVGVLSF